MKYNAILAFLCILVVACGEKNSKPGEQIQIPRHYIAHKTNTEINIDGIDSEAGWGASEWTADFLDIEGVKKPKPEFRTRAKMLWDERNLYVFAEMEEPHIWGDIIKRDAVIFHNNDFEIFIKPDSYCSTYGEIEINALGTIWDLKLRRPYRNHGKAQNDWDISGLQSAVGIHGTLNDPADIDSGWSVEFAIPLWEIANLCGENISKDSELWRINFSRVEWRYEIEQNKYRRMRDPATGKLLREDNWVWSPQHAVDMHRPEHWGYLQFSELPPGTETDTIRDPFETEYQLLFLLHREQIKFFRSEKRYAESIEQLIGQTLPLKGKNVHIRVLPKGAGYKMSVNTAGNRKLVIDESGDIRIEKINN